MNNNEIESLIEQDPKPTPQPTPAPTIAPIVTAAPVATTAPVVTSAPASVEVSSNSEDKDEKTFLDKRMLIIIAVVVVVIIAAVFLVFGFANGDNKKENGKEKDKTTEEKTDNNTNPGVIEDKEQDGLTFTNSSLTFNENSSTLTTVVKNTTSYDIEVRVFDIIITDESGNILVTLQGYVGGNIPAGESREIVSNVDMNLENAFDVEYKIVN